MQNIGFIGVGYMGYGIAKNVLNKGNNLFVIANKNRKPIEKIVSEGAKEVKSLEEFKEKQLNVLIKCVTNTPIAKEIASKLSSILDEKTLIIDITTHNKTGSIETEQIIFVKDVPKFLGKNREVYGPFKPGDIAMLDKDITKILINKKHAKLILN